MPKVIVNVPPRLYNSIIRRRMSQADSIAPLAQKRGVHPVSVPSGSLQKVLLNSEAVAKAMPSKKISSNSKAPFLKSKKPTIKKALSIKKPEKSTPIGVTATAIDSTSSDFLTGEEEEAMFVGGAARPPFLWTREAVERIRAAENEPFVVNDFIKRALRNYRLPTNGTNGQQSDEQHDPHTNGQYPRSSDESAS